jgi:serine/threonine protein kinase
MFGFPDEEDGIHGKYRLLAELGQGGTANVYLAVAAGPSGFNKLVVLKLLRAELAGEAQFRRMFLNEARLAARLNHPNVVQTNEVFEEGGRPIIVMEYLEGASLSKVLARSREQRNPISMPMHLQIISEALSGLEYAHELRDYDGRPLGVVHRDMTPQNIFVSFDGKISLLDFGIAKLAGSTAETQTGVVKGKIRYMPPEQILGETVDRRTDIFAVGVMLWEAVAGEKMWRGVSDATIMHNIVNNVIPSPKTARPDVADELEAICMKALAFSPDDRYATAAELQADLEEWLSNRPVSNREIGRFVDLVFGDVRAKTRELIERRLRHVAAQEPPSHPFDDVSIDVPVLADAMRRANESPTQTQAISVRAPLRWRIAWLTLPLLVFATVLFFGRALWKQGSPGAMRSGEAAGQKSSNGSEAAAAPESAASVPAARHVILKVGAAPIKARLYLDGQRLSSNPYSATAPADSAEHSIRAEAPGYVPEKRIVTFDKDVDLELGLVPVPYKPIRGKMTPRPSGSVTADAPPVVEGPQVDCNPPYYIDENGIRRLKPECL